MRVRTFGRIEKQKMGSGDGVLLELERANGRLVWLHRECCQLWLRDTIWLRDTRERLADDAFEAQPEPVLKHDVPQLSECSFSCRPSLAQLRVLDV
jgi:hypothetical protein